MFILLPTLERRMFVALVVCKVGQSLLAYIQDMGFTVTTFSCATGSQNVVQGHKNSKINLITLTQIEMRCHTKLPIQNKMYGLRGKRNEYAEKSNPTKIVNEKKSDICVILVRIIHHHIHN
jgi:hypothetical protein